MPKYNLTRKLNLKRFFPEMQYETIDFAVLEADSAEQAEKELETWIKKWLSEKAIEYKMATLKETDPFMKEMEATGDAFTKATKTGKKPRVINAPKHYDEI